MNEPLSANWIYRDYTNGTHFGQAMINYNSLHTLRSTSGGIRLHDSCSSGNELLIAGSVSTQGTIDIDGSLIQIPEGTCALAITCRPASTDTCMSEVVVDVCGQWQVYTDISPDYRIGRRWVYGCEEYQCDDVLCCYNVISILHTASATDVCTITGPYGRYRFIPPYLIVEVIQPRQFTEIHTVAGEGMGSNTVVIDVLYDALVSPALSGGLLTLTAPEETYTITREGICLRTAHSTHRVSARTPSTTARVAHISLKFKGKGNGAK